jgi:hypothetical protein
MGEIHVHEFITADGGVGPRLFEDGAAPMKLELARADTYDNGVAYLAYRPQT